MWGWNWLATVVDLSFPDLLSIVCTVVFPLHRLWKARGGASPRAELLIADLLRGAAFSTFILVIMMAVSKQFMNVAYDHNRVVLFLAGVIGAAAGRKGQCAGLAPLALGAFRVFGRRLVVHAIIRCVLD